MRKPRILIVDDREFDRILYKEYLEEVNYDFFELDDGHDLIDFLSNNEIDLILLDWQMPRIGGLESLKNIQQNKIFKEIPVIIITGLKEESVLEEAFNHGANDFIYKPVTKTEIRSRVNALFNLAEANKMLLLQKEEMIELNNIIRQQKNDLQESINIKSSLGEEKIKTVQSELQDKNQKIRKLELEMLQVKNGMKGFRIDLESFVKSLRERSKDDSLNTSARKLVRQLDTLQSSEVSYHESQDILDSLDPEFSKKLVSNHPRLTNLDLKHCAFIKLNMENNDVANILNVELKSLQMTRYRLKKKLGLDEKISLREYLVNL